MSLFDGPKYASFIALCRELRLEREPEFGDLWLDATGAICVDISDQGEGGWLHARGPMGDLEQLNGGCVWLPRLDQWVNLIAEAIFAKHPEFREAAGSRYLARRDALNAIAKHWTDHPTISVEEAAARLYCAVTGQAGTA